MSSVNFDAYQDLSRQLRAMREEMYQIVDTIYDDNHKLRNENWELRKNRSNEKSESFRDGVIGGAIIGVIGVTFISAIFAPKPKIIQPKNTPETSGFTGVNSFAPHKL